jgi:hypothetical protein
MIREETEESERGKKKLERGSGLGAKESGRGLLWTTEESEHFAKVARLGQAMGLAAVRVAPHGQCKCLRIALRSLQRAVCHAFDLVVVCFSCKRHGSD